MARLNAVSSVPSEDLKKLQTTVAAFEIRIPDMIKELTTRNEKIKEDLEKTLQSSEYKVKGLDQLYKENSAETELLYEKLNNELARMVKILKNKGKDQVHELVQKVKEDTEEIARIKKENARLRRENVTLRALLKGNDLL
jgi:DNA anti-recombination protein RmuC